VETGDEGNPVPMRTIRSIAHEEEGKKSTLLQTLLLTWVVFVFHQTIWQQTFEFLTMVWKFARSFAASTW
jgi:hypothetical protein